MKAIDKLKEDNYDFVLVDLPQNMLVAYKLSLPFGLIGIDPPHLIRRIPYLPRYVFIKNNYYVDHLTEYNKKQLDF